MELKQISYTPEQIQDIIKDITMFKVFSSNVLALGYSEKYQVLRVIFKNKTSYLYFNVEPNIWEQLKVCNSKGSVLRESVIKHKDKYKFIKL